MELFSILKLVADHKTELYIYVLYATNLTKRMGTFLYSVTQCLVKSDHFIQLMQSYHRTMLRNFGKYVYESLAFCYSLILVMCIM